MSIKVIDLNYTNKSQDIQQNEHPESVCTCEQILSV